MLKIKNSKEKDKKWIITTIVIAILILFLFPLLLVKLVLGRTGGKTAADSGTVVAFSTENEGGFENGSGENVDGNTDGEKTGEGGATEGEAKGGANAGKSADAAKSNSGNSSSVNGSVNNSSTKNNTPAIVHPSQVVLSSNSLSLTKGQSGTLSASVQPANAANKSVVYSSTNPAVATVGANGRVTAIKKGEATIIAKTVDGGVAAEAKITVSNPPLVVEVNIYPTHAASPAGDIPGADAVISRVSGGSGSYTSTITMYRNGASIGNNSSRVFAQGEGTYQAKWKVVDAEEGERTGETEAITVTK